METAEEQRVHSPPASLVPRLHMLYAAPLQHNNPLLPVISSADDSACKDYDLHSHSVFKSSGYCYSHISLPCSSLREQKESKAFCCMFLKLSLKRIIAANVFLPGALRHCLELLECDIF